MKNSFENNSFSPRAVSRIRLISACLVTLLALVAIIYGVSFNHTTITTKQDDSSSQQIDLAETQIILDTTRGGLVRTESGQIQRTYAETPPSVCPT